MFFFYINIAFFPIPTFKFEEKYVLIFERIHYKGNKKELFFVYWWQKYSIIILL